MESVSTRSQRVWALRFRLQPTVLVALVALYIVSAQNIALWRRVLDSLPSLADSWTMMITLPIALWALMAALVALLSIVGPMKTVLVTLLLVGAICSYFMQAFGVVVDRNMLVNVLQTDFSESADLVGLPLLTHILLLGVLPCLVVARITVITVSRLHTTLRLLLFSALSAGLSIGLVLTQYKEISFWARANRHLQYYVNPTYPLYGAYRYVKSTIKGARAPKAVTIIAPDAKLQGSVSVRPLLLVLVIGETARASQFSLNGYSRLTNPRLSQIPDLLNYPDVTACGTATAISLPCMFSHLGRRGYSDRAAATQENALDVLQRVGVKVHWDDNNAGCKGVCSRVKSEQFNRDVFDAVGGPERGFDEHLVDQLEAHLKDGISPLSLFVLHQNGSHGPAYFRRYPSTFSRFKPECRREDVQACTVEEVVNAYDNSILYTDHVLAELIELLQERQASIDSALIYISDHGESLGEAGIYLHGLPRAIAPADQLKVPMVAWLSEGAWARLQIDPACVVKGQMDAYSHDNLFDTLLGLFSVKTQTYHVEDDLFGACRVS